MLPLLCAQLLCAPASAGDEPLRPSDLVGTWALEMVALTAAKVPVVGEVESTTRTGVLVRLELQPDGSLIHHHQPCGSEISGGALIKTRVPRSYFERMPYKLLHPVITPTEEGLRYEADVLRFVGGWDPTVCSKVPSEADDPCVRDWDEDGEPAITIQVKAPLFPWVDVYVAQQTHPYLHGIATSADRISGQLTVTEVDNQVLGASNRLFAANPTTRMLNDRSSFVMTRIPDGSTCADVIEAVGLDPGW